MSSNRNNRNGGNNHVHINKDAAEFAKLDFKKFKKRNKDYYDSKKEFKEAYYMLLIDLLPQTIDFVVKYGYIKKPEIQQAKNAILAKMNDPKFIKVVRKELKDGNSIENIKLMPIIINEILQEAAKRNAQAVAEDPNAQVYDMHDMVELAELILKKKFKKLEKGGLISHSLAFDILSVIPCDDCLKGSQFYRIRTFYDVLYEHSKGGAVPFDKIMDVLIDKEYVPAFIVFALLERKTKFSSLSDNQKALYLDISTWCFNTMEQDLDKDEIMTIIKLFVNGRKKDEAAGKDGNRRYALSTLSEEDYPRIRKVIANMVSKDESIQKYL